jgi:hypothetical protein
MKEILSPSDIPTELHFQVLCFEEQTIHHEGDERSRTNPGHGYPAYTEKIKYLKIFVTESNQPELELESFILKLEKSNSHGKTIYAVTQSKKMTVLLDTRVILS